MDRLDTESREPGAEPMPGGEETECAESEEELASAAATETLLERAAAVEKSLERLWKLDAKREERFDRLHGELETYRQGQQERVTDPLLFSLIKLRDGFSKRQRAWRTKDPEEVSKERLLEILEDCIDDVDLALEHHGVTAFEEPTDELSLKRQTVVRTVSCDDERVGRLAERIGPGFEKGERLLIKERVMVYARNSQPSHDGDKEPMETENHE